MRIRALRTRAWRPAANGLLAAALAGLSGCSPQDGAPATPTAPAPAPTPAPEPTAEVRELPFGFGGAFFQPDLAFELPEGKTLGLEVRSLSPTLGADYTGGGEWPGLPIGLATDAPEGRLSVPPLVRVGGRRQPGLAEITALSSGGDAVSEEYRIWLTESPELNLAPGFVVAYDPTPVRVRVRKAEDEPPPTCLLPEVAFETQGMARAGGEMAASVYGVEGLTYWSADWTLRVPDPGTTVTVAAPYRKPFALADEAARRGEGLPHRPLLLGSSFSTRATATGLEQTMNLGWFTDLRLVVESPGCEPVEVVCVRERCRVQ